MSIRGYSENDFEPVREASVTNPEDFDGDVLNTFPDKTRVNNTQLSKLAEVIKETTYRAMSVKETYTKWIDEYFKKDSDVRRLITIGIIEPISNKSTIHLLEPTFLYDVDIGVGICSEESDSSVSTHSIRIRVDSEDRLNYTVFYQLKTKNPVELLNGLGITKGDEMKSLNLRKEDFYKLLDELFKEENL